MTENAPGCETIVATALVGLVDAQRRDAVGELGVVGERVVDEHRHADRRLVDAMAQPFEVGVVVVEALVDLAQRPEDAALVATRRVAMARALVVVVEFVGQATALALVEARAGEDVAVLDVGRGAETNRQVGVEALQRREDRRLLCRREVGFVVDQVADVVERVEQGVEVRRRVGGERRQQRGDPLAQRRRRRRSAGRGSRSRDRT